MQMQDLATLTMWHQDGHVQTLASRNPRQIISKYRRAYLPIEQRFQGRKGRAIDRTGLSDLIITPTNPCLFAPFASVRGADIENHRHQFISMESVKLWVSALSRKALHLNVHTALFVVSTVRLARSGLESDVFDVS